MTTRSELARARIEHEAGGRLLAHLARAQGSGSLPSVAAIDALVLIPQDRTELRAGEKLAAIPFGAGRGSEHHIF